MIKLENISVVFDTDKGPLKAVDDVSLSIKQGEIYGIVGYSGAGKSTLVRVMNLLQRPNEGKVTTNGQELLSLNPKELRQARKKIGMIFQHFNLMDSRNVFDNVAFPLKGSGLSRAQIKEKVDDLLETVGLAGRQKDYPSQLSGGQKQRVAIARALANDPDILLCDEATSALDPKTTGSILDLLRKLNKKLDLTIVIITHEMAVVKDLCHRVAVMDGGRVIEQGTIIEIFTDAKEELTQEFIDTATNFEKEAEVVLEYPTTRKLVENGTLVRLHYVGEVTTQALVAELSREYQVDANIIYGNVEFLQKTPVGNLLVILSGTSSQQQKGIDHLRENGVKVEVIKKGEGYGEIR